MSGNQSSFSMLSKIANYTEILAKDPRSTVFVSLSEAYRQMGMLDDALEIVRKGIQMLPEFAPGYTALGRIQVQKGKLDEAARSFEKALDLDSDSMAALIGLAKVNLKTGNRARSRELLQKAAARQPDDDSLRKMLEHLGPEAPRPAQTSPISAPGPSGPEKNTPPQQRTRPARQEDDPISTATIAEIYIRQGFLKRAAKVYRDLLHADPHNEEIRHKLVALKKRIDAEEQRAESPESPDKTIFEPERFSPRPPDPQGDETDATYDIGNEDPVLAAFNDWLVAIQKRRDHVR